MQREMTTLYSQCQQLESDTNFLNCRLSEYKERAAILEQALQNKDSRGFPIGGHNREIYYEEIDQQQASSYSANVNNMLYDVMTPEERKRTRKTFEYDVGDPER